MNVKGLKLSDILNMDWSDLNAFTAKELKQLTSRLVSAANKRVRNLKKSELGTSSPAYQTVAKRGRLFSVKGKNVNQVRNEFKLVSNFLKMKTSTVSGWKSYQKDVADKMKRASGIDINKWSNVNKSKMWAVYRKFEELHGGEFKKGDSDRIIQFLMETLDKTETMTEDELLDALDREYQTWYEEDPFDDDDYEEWSDLFDDKE